MDRAAPRMMAVVLVGGSTGRHSAGGAPDHAVRAAPAEAASGASRRRRDIVVELAGRQKDTEAARAPSCPFEESSGDACIGR